MPSQNWSANRVRQTFIDFFASRHGHKFVPSSPCVPHDDPTLLFANAGMNQFKPLFLGQGGGARPGDPLHGLTRAVNSQKCIRAGGKHNDLEDVGKDTYHHTFFEMLGNWSFGDYFKKEAIEWSWELLTKVYGLPPAALYATYFGGNKDAGLEPDLETKSLWEKFLPPDRILPGGMKDNFWEMGETGPCGPCTEIHVDRLVANGQSTRLAAEKVNQSDPDVIEIWNNVFIQFNRVDAKTLNPLPAKHVDTGMGLERLVSILQHKRSNYDTDVFFPIFAAIERLTKERHQYHGRLGAADKDHTDTAFRVIADHIRTIVFAITDGATPSNEGRGYVLRRILRRAVRYGKQTLGMEPGFFAKLVPTVVETFGEFFPELRKNPDRVMGIIKDEEDGFGRTLDRGLKLFDEAAARSGASKPISGDDSFRLHDTYGFPIDLTMQMAEERGLSVDIAGYERLMGEARDKARAGSGGKFSSAPGSGNAAALQPENIAQLESLGVHRTADTDKFHGRQVRAQVKAIWNGSNFDEHTRMGMSKVGQPVAIILDRTSFYAEMGGQEADHGRLNVTREARTGSTLHEGGGGEFRVEEVRAFGGYVLHIGHINRGEVRVGDDVLTHIDSHRRHAICANHTGTHLLNLALRDVLGDGADQKGSLVAGDRLRFDFGHPRAVTPEELAAVERGVEDRIRQDLKVYTDAAPLTPARTISGVRAVFGETYPDPVRIVSIGQPVATLMQMPRHDWKPYSIEFCGGVHVNSTREIGKFVLAAEEAVAKGIRRITALTGVPAQAALTAADGLAARLQNAAKLPTVSLAAEVSEIAAEMETMTLPATRKPALRAALAVLQERIKGEQKQASAAKAAQASVLARQVAESALAAGSQVIVNTIDVGDDRKALQAALNTIAQACPRSAVMLFGPDEAGGVVAIVAAVPQTLVGKGLSAGDWVREAATILGGKGGGKPEAAQGGGTNFARLRESIASAQSFALKKLGL
ncbi:MAG: alanine--tRNA ligase [Phycisphaerales bacterium]|nr:alanine--tRNA ligase [Phycisphaerales bacterium]